MDIHNKADMEQYFAEHFDTSLFPVLADIYYHDDDINRARKVCEIGLQYHPQQTDGLLVLARIAREDGNLKEAESCLKKIEATGRMQRAAAIMLAEVQETLERSPHTRLASWERVLEFDPHHREAHRMAVQIRQFFADQKSDSTVDVPRKPTPSQPSRARSKLKRQIRERSQSSVAPMTEEEKADTEKDTSLPRSMSGVAKTPPPEEDVSAEEPTLEQETERPRREGLRGYQSSKSLETIDLPDFGLESEREETPEGLPEEKSMEETPGEKSKEQPESESEQPTETENKSLKFRDLEATEKDTDVSIEPPAAEKPKPEAPQSGEKKRQAAHPLLEMPDQDELEQARKQEKQRQRDSIRDEDDPDKISISPHMATFTMVSVLVNQELYHQALKVLEMLENRGSDLYRISMERRRIKDIMKGENRSESGDSKS